MHSPSTERQAIGVAFSGGGVRAASFMCGLLWRLAESGWLRHVDHLSAVSGGTYPAAAFASHVAAGGSPQPGEGVDVWYRRVVTACLLRFQRNVGYLVKSWRPDGPWFVPQDGSRHLPPFFDLPLLILWVVGSLVLSPVLLAMYLAVPVVVIMEHDLGASMRNFFCDPGCSPGEECYKGAAPLLQHTQQLIVMIGTAIAATTVLWFLTSFGAFKPQKCSDAKRSCCCPRNGLYLTARAIRQVLLRGMAVATIYLLAVWLVMGIQMYNWGTAALSDSPLAIVRNDVNDGLSWQLQGKWVRQRCLAYIDEHFDPDTSKYRCSDTEATWQSPWYEDREYHETYRNSSWLASRVYGSIPKKDEHAPFRYFFKSWAWMSLLSVVGGVAALALRLPFLEYLGAVAGPLWAIYFVASVGRWKVFGPITKQYFILNVLKYEDDVSHNLIMFLVAVVVTTVPFYDTLHRSIHVLYSRSMRKAYYAKGRDFPLSGVATNPYCPNLIMGAVVTECARPTDTVHYADFSLTPLFVGGDRTGCWPAPPWFSMSRAMGISGAAIDAIVSLVDEVTTRWWIGMFNLQMGDWVCMSTWDESWFLARRGFRLAGHRALQQFAMALPGIVLVGSLYFLIMVGVAFEVQTARQACFGSFLILGAVILFVAFFVGTFFTYHPCCRWLRRLPLVQRLHMMLQVHYKSDEVPENLYLSDGGLFECLGLLALLRRRSRWMLVADATAVWDDPCKCLRQSLALAVSEGLGSFFDPADPRRDLTYVMQEFSENTRQPFLHLSVHYEGGEGEVGDLFFIRMRIPEDDNMPLQPLLTENELLGRTDQAMKEMELPEVASLGPRGSSAPRRPSAPVDEAVGGPLRRDLGGACCYDSCHSSGLQCGSRFPNIGTANQCFTPLLFANLCRLGHELSGPALAAIDAAMASPNK